MQRCAHRLAALAAGALTAAFPPGLRAQTLDSARIVAGANRVISATAAAMTEPAPGCAVGIAMRGHPIYERAFGMADLEYAIPNTPHTIFESGSVAKQFTAASIVLLALDGKLRLDDVVRKYIPELPDYGVPLTIRHLLNHTGGVRDWGSVMALTGVGRGDRVITQALAMDVITRQRGLDFTPGSEYSYSNSGYTLLTTIVERVSGQRLPVFTAERFFKPLGMTHTTWRTDYRTVVPGRAQAYAPQRAGAWRLDMPFMDVYGNGGMLTTVGDWLKWNEMFDSRSLGGALVDSMETTGVLSDGRRISYALGLTVATYHGLRQVAHGGSTAGYQTYLVRYPDSRLSVAVMCNGASLNPTALAHGLVDEIMGPFPAPPAPDTISLGATTLARHVSLWREVDTHMPVRTVFQHQTLRVVGGAPLRALRDGSFEQGEARWRFTMAADGQPVTATRTSGDEVAHYVAEREWSPTPAELAQFAGVWHSNEAEATFTFAVDGERAALVQRPATRIALTPQYKDHFTLGNGANAVLWFTRDAAGRVTALHMGASRVRDMPFARRSPGP